MPITLGQLSTFLAVARTGSVTAAAEALYVSQPSVSASLSALSREVGTPLTRRVGRRIELTAAGASFAVHAADVLGLLERGRTAAHEAAGIRTQELRIAAVTTAGEFIVPPLLQAFAERAPVIEVSLEVANRERVLQRLLEHEADVAISGRPPEDGRLAGEPFLENELVLVLPPGDELARRRTLPLDELAGRTWLLREEGSGTRALVESVLAASEQRPRTLTLGSNGAIKGAVRAGLGVSIQSRIAVDLELRTGVLAEGRLTGLPRRHWHVLHSTSGVPRPAVASFLDFVTGPTARAALA